MTDTTLITAIEASLVPQPDPQDQPARFAFPVPDGRSTTELAAEIEAALAPLGATVTALTPMSQRDQVITLPGRQFADPARAFDAAQAIAVRFRLPVVEPEIFHGVMPADPALAAPDDLESATFPPGCWVEEDKGLETQKSWALARMNVPAAWAHSQSLGRPSKGKGIVIAQPDTGITVHAELRDVDRAAMFNLLEPDRPLDATDPLSPSGNPGHGTATASVVVSLEAGDVTGSAPLARHMPIRAIESVIRVSQVKVAEAIDRAVDAGAHVITMSLGGIFSISLHRALLRAVEANVIVLAAAGNCVKLVVWPARFDDCIAVAGTNFKDAPWKGSCRGSDVDVSAPAENVYRASVTEPRVGQGQGTSFAVALTAGVAACWLAHHGRNQLIAEARAQGETLQAMFRRLLKATARRPKGEWDEWDMGPGVVDALALLKADFDQGRETEGPIVTGITLAPDQSIRGFAFEAFGEESLESTAPEAPGFDWQQHGAEISLRVLQARARGGEAELEGATTAASAALQAALPADLRAKLGLAAPEGVAAPAVRSAAAEPADPAVADRARQQRRMLAAREAADKQGSLESAPGLESSVPDDAPLPHPDDVFDRIDKLIKAMPASEIGDPQAFRQAIELLHRHGHPALSSLVDPDAAARATADQVAALEAVVIADGSRPSFLLREGFPPETHPFLGMWEQKVNAFRNRLQPIAQSVGRVQPSGGHASFFVGTASLVDREKMLALTNYHVVDDARAKFGVPMTQVDRKVTIHRGLEIDFVGEADSLASNRFKVVEAFLPEHFGRGLGGVDAAVLRIEPLNERSTLPSAVAKFSGDPNLMTGSLTSLSTIGFPGLPPQLSGKTGDVDWSFVVTALFGGQNRFGLKRLAPGTFHKSLGSHSQDTREIAFGHSATTFGGASGSLIIAWGETGSPCFGLHFAGATGKSNWAVSMAAAADSLRKIGVPIP
jgi:serine protease